MPGTSKLSIAFLTPSFSPYIKRSMKTFLRTLALSSAVILFSSAASLSDPSSFPSNGLDAQSLGRGGTVIAARPGVWSSFGNPAALTPAQQYVLGIDYLDQKDTSEESWGFSIVDTSSSIRGALSYYTNPDFAGFKKEMWGVSLCQTLLPSLFLGESFHMGKYEPDAAPGTKKSINTFDAGLLFNLGSHVSLGYVMHNLLPSDSDLFEQYNGIGIGMQFPMTIYLTVDYEDDPEITSEKNLRTGIEFNPLKNITGRFGYQDRADGSNYLSFGITYSDSNGTLDGAILYNDETDKTDTIALGLSIRM
jgi:hypothetical protein